MSYINRDAFLAEKRKLYCGDCDRRKGMKNGKLRFCYEVGGPACKACGVDDILVDVEDYPAADVRPVVRGENIGTVAECDQFICSKCGIHLENWVRVEIDEDDGDVTHHEYVFNVCPNCGADIRKEGKPCTE